MPQKLLKPKEKKYNNDDEFIEQFLEEKRKQEEALRAAMAAELAKKLKKRKKPKGWASNSKYTDSKGGSDSRKMQSKFSKYSSQQSPNSPSGERSQSKTLMKKMSSMAEKKFQNTVQTSTHHAASQRTLEVDLAGINEEVSEPRTSNLDPSSPVKSKLQTDAVIEEDDDESGDQEQVVEEKKDEIFEQFNKEMRKLKKQMIKQSILEKNMMNLGRNDQSVQ